MRNSNLNLKNKKVIIVTHRSIMPCIPGNDLLKFLVNHGCQEILYIRHPLLLLEESWKLTSSMQHVHGDKVLSKDAPHFRMPEAFMYVKDFIYTLFWTLMTRQKYDLYFGINNLNALAGLILKRLGKVRKVVYYTIDLYPQRFGNRFINWLYHRLDNYCVDTCDETWNVSPFLVDYRLKKGLSKKSKSKQFTVPIGIWYDEMERIPDSKIKKTTIAYVGHLKALYGLDLAVKALPKIKKKVPKIHLDIVGGGEQREELEKLAKKLGVLENMTFYGWKEKKEAERIISFSRMGLAPFNTKVDEKIKNADPAKIKDYLALGLPVITTDAPLTASEIENTKCGIVIDFTPESMAEAVINLLSNKKRWSQYRKNALSYVQKFDWNNLFSKNISRLIKD